MSVLLALLVFASSIALLVFLILAIVKFFKKDSKAGIKHLIFTGVSFFGMIFFSIIFIFTIDTSDLVLEDEPEMIETSTEEKEEIEPIEELKEEPEEIVEENITPPPSESVEDKVKKIIKDELGETNNRSVEVLNSVVIGEEETGEKGVIISLNGSDNFSPKMIKRKMWMDSIDILEPLHTLNEFDIILVNWYFPLVDQYGNESDSLVMSIDMNKETLDKINWENFLTDNLPNVADHYHNHPALND